MLAIRHDHVLPPDDQWGLVMSDDSYIDGLRAAEAACWARSKSSIDDRRKHPFDLEAQKDCVIGALEAADCAGAILRLIEARESWQPVAAT
jgi:hypothetical protein